MAPEETGVRDLSAMGPHQGGLVDAAIALAEDLDLGRVQEAIVAQAAFLCPDALALFVAAADGSEFGLRAYRGLASSYLSKARVTAGDARALAARAAEGSYTYATSRRAPRWVRRLLSGGRAGSVTIFPLEHAGQLAGLLALLYKAEEGSQMGEPALAFSRLAAGALGNALQHRETEAAAAESTLLLQVSQLLSATFETEAIARRVTEEAGDLMESDLCALYLYDPIAEDLGLLALAGEACSSPPEGELQRTPISSLLATMPAALQGQAVTSEWPGEGSLLALLGPCYRVQTGLTVPLHARGNLLGLLFFARRSLRRYSLREADLGRKLAALAALSLDNARLYADLDDQMRRAREAQAQLIEAEKMASLGRIVAGVAHALNNPLATVSGYAQLLLAADVPEDVRDDLARIDRGARRAAEIVRELLAFARQRPLVPVAVPVAELVRAALKREAPALHEAGIEVEVDLPEGLPHVRGDRLQLEQVLVHLVANARDAIVAHAGSSHLAIRARQGQGVRIAVSDDGAGFPAELLDKVFEPFLTTREVGHGMGMGLAVSYGIVRAHGGRIWAGNNPGGGATVYIELPTARSEAG